MSRKYKYNHMLCFVLVLYDFKSANCLACFFIAGDPIFDDILHPVLQKACCVSFFFNLCQGILTSNLQISIVRIFYFNYDPCTASLAFYQDIAEALPRLRVGYDDPVLAVA